MISATKKGLTILCSVLILLSLLLPASAYLGSESRQIINSSSLTPLVTGYTPLDQKVANFFASNFSSSATTYDKLKICYDYLIYGSSYGSASISTSVYNEIDKECGYYSSSDKNNVARAYGFLNSKRGACNDFAAAFLVMSRAIGLETYIMEGTITWYAGTNSHVWCLTKIGSSYYIFDPEAEWRNYSNNGSISYSNFCIPEEDQSGIRSYNRSSCIGSFGNFRCKNKTNNPGTVIHGTAEYEDNVYTPGKYVTYDVMNFRSGHGTSYGIICTIPSGTTVQITEVYGIWGKLTYQNNSGWISLDYSTKIKDTTPVVPPDDTPSSSAYKTGTYKTNDNMRLRADHNTSAAIYCLIPAGTTLTVTSIYNEWGKTTYKGQSGWLSLEYSTYQGGSSTGPKTLAGDADGDGKVDAADARLVLRHSVSLETIKSAYLSNADMNNDGMVDAADARLVLRRSVRLE